MYLKINDPDSAIAMYKNHRQFSRMVDLVRRYQPSLISETLSYLAQQLEAEGNLQLAEQYNLEAGNWKAVVASYRKKEMWEDALRVARQHGGDAAVKQISYARAKSLGGEAASKWLIKMGLLELVGSDLIFSVLFLMSCLWLVSFFCDAHELDSGFFFNLWCV